MFFTIQTDYRYTILFFSIEKPRFRCKISVFHCKNGVFHYTNGLSIHNTIFFYIKPRFRYNISVFPCKNGVFHYTNGLSIHNTIFFYRKPRFRCKISVFPCKNSVFLTIQTNFRYIILFSSIENLVFDVKFQSFIVKTVFFNYTYRIIDI